MRNAMRGLFLILAAGNFLYAQSVVIVANVGAENGTVSPLGYQVAVSFKSPVDPPPVTSVTLLLDGAEGAPNVTLALHQPGFVALLGLPGILIAELGNLVVPPGTNQVTFTPSAPVPLAPSTDYFLVLTCHNCVEDDMGPDTLVGWRYTSTVVTTGLPGATVSAGTLTGGGDMWEYFADRTPIFSVNGHLGAITLDAEYQVRYASNLVHGDSVVNITNTGSNGAPLYGPGFGEAAGNLCINVYAFSPDEQLISCCSCLVTPNGLVNLTANRDLVSNTLTGIRPDSIVIKLVATATGVLERVAEEGIQGEPRGIPTFTGSTCTNSAALAGTNEYQVASGLLAWGTTLHSTSEPAAPASMALAETQFLPASLSYQELKSIRERCANIIGNGSTFGQCRSCRLGGLGGAKQ